MPIPPIPNVGRIKQPRPLVEASGPRGATSAATERWAFNTSQRIRRTKHRSRPIQQRQQRTNCPPTCRAVDFTLSRRR